MLKAEKLFHFSVANRSRFRSGTHGNIVIITHAEILLLELDRNNIYRKLHFNIIYNLHFILSFAHAAGLKGARGECDIANCIN